MEPGTNDVLEAEWRSTLRKFQMRKAPRVLVGLSGSCIAGTDNRCCTNGTSGGSRIAAGDSNIFPPSGLLRRGGRASRPAAASGRCRPCSCCSSPSAGGGCWRPGGARVLSSKAPSFFTPYHVLPDWYLKIIFCLTNTFLKCMKYFFVKLHDHSFLHFINLFLNVTIFFECCEVFSRITQTTITMYKHLF